MTTWVTRAAQQQIARKTQAILDVFHSADIKDEQLLSKVIMEVINQCQSGQGYIFSADLFCIAKKLLEVHNDH